MAQSHLFASFRATGPRINTRVVRKGSCTLCDARGEAPQTYVKSMQLCTDTAAIGRNKQTNLRRE